MSKGSHFTCRCATSLTFRGKVCFNPRRKRAKKGRGHFQGLDQGQQPSKAFKRSKRERMKSILVLYFLSKLLKGVHHVIKYQIFWTHSGCIMTSPSSRQTYILGPMAPPIMLAAAQTLERKWNYDFFFGGSTKQAIYQTCRPAPGLSSVITYRRRP